MSRLARLVFPITAVLALFAACLSPSQGSELLIAQHGQMHQGPSLHR